MSKLLIPIFILPVLIFAQSSFDTLNSTNLGTVKSFYACADNTPILENTTGNNVTWDFSQAVGSNGIRQVSALSPTNTSFSGEYAANSNRALVIENFMLTYYDRSNGHLKQSGYVIPNTDLGDIKAKFFTDKWNQMTFPFMYNANSSDTYSGNIAFTLNGTQQNPTATGKGYTKYDGFGTLLLPDGTTSLNVSRLTSIDTLFTSIPLFGAIRLIREQYEYYQLDSAGNLPLFITGHAKVLSSLPDPLIDIRIVLSSKYPSAQLGNNEKVNELETIQLYPNPSNGSVSLTGKMENTEYKLFDAQGRLVNFGNTKAQMSWNINAGVYHLHISGENGQIQRKIVVQ